MRMNAYGPISRAVVVIVAPGILAPVAHVMKRAEGQQKQPKLSALSGMDYGTSLEWQVPIDHLVAETI
jgi:hypothetical protein